MYGQTTTSKNLFLNLLTFTVLLSSCASPTPAGQIETQVAATVAARDAATATVEQAVKLTLTASAPTATTPPTSTFTPIPPTATSLPTATPVPTLVPTSPPLPTLAPTLPPAIPTSAPTVGNDPENWAISFVYNFPVGFWSVGTHQYTIIAQPCGDNSGGSFTQSFQVSNNAPLYPVPIYLRLSGLRNSRDGSVINGAINSAQSTIGILDWTKLKQSKVEATKQCKVFISWDGGAQQPLVAQAPYQR